MLVIQYQELFDTLKNILYKYDFEEEDATLCAEIFSNNTLVGVASHGVNRFPSFIELINEGLINVNFNS